MLVRSGDYCLSRLKKQVEACRICVGPDIANPLPHAPRPVLVATRRARIAIVGQAPGTRVHRSGIPFDDRSGDRLRQWMALERAQFYDETKLAIIPMGFCFPGLDEKGGDLPPRPECAKQWRSKVMAALPQLQLILVIGIYAQKWHLGKLQKENLTQTVRNWREYRDMAPSMFPLPHPSWRNNGWLKKNDWFEKKLLGDLQEAIHRYL